MTYLVYNASDCGYVHDERKCNIYETFQDSKDMNSGGELIPTDSANSCATKAEPEEDELGQGMDERRQYMGGGREIPGVWENEINRGGYARVKERGALAYKKAGGVSMGATGFSWGCRRQNEKRS